MRVTSVAVAMVVWGIVACAKQPDGPGVSPNLTGVRATYVLTDVDAQPLPANAYFGVDVSVTATAGTLVLAQDGNYLLTVAYDRFFASGGRRVPFTLTEGGTWARSGSDIVLTPTGGTPHTATISGNHLTLVLTVPDSPPPERATKTYAFIPAP